MRVFPRVKTQIVSNESIKLFRQAIEMLQSAGAELNDETRQEAIVLLLLAIAQAGAPFTRAHSLLAMLLYELGNTEPAESHLAKALEHDPLDFRAQLLRVQIAAEELQRLKSQARTHTDNFVIGKWEFESDSVFLAQMRFHEKAKRLIEVFQELCDNGLHAVEFLYFATQLFAAGEFMLAHTYSGISRPPNVYAVIANAKVENLIYDEEAALQREAIDEVRDLARGLA